MINQKYRPDVDGLRALAVLAVIGFHAFPGWVRSGFIGVDIFFVISGFVISNSIIVNLNNNTFSYLDFYARRIKRIFPALIIILAVSFVTWWYLLSPIDQGLKSLGKHIAAGAAFLSNFVFWNEAGYFDSSAEQKPLLHLWSLAIEEQFYIAWPLLLVFGWKHKKLLAPLIATLVMISFAYNIFSIKSNPIATFYSPLTRFWELIAGGLIAYTLSQQEPPVIAKYRNTLGWIGFSLIAAGLTLIHKDKQFPGGWALLPVLGCALLILSGPNTPPNKFIFSNRFLVWIGLISYPLYLWHWPALALHAHVSHLFEFNLRSDRITKIIVIFSSIILAWITYKFIEKPIRNSSANKALSVTLLLTMVATGIMGLVVFKLDINKFRFTDWQQEEIKKLENIVKLQDLEKMYGSKPCFIFDRKYTHELFEKNDCFNIKLKNNPIVFLYGDSHSASLSLGLKPYFEEKNINFLQVSSGWCEPTSNNADNQFCEKINKLALSKIKEIKPDIVIMNSYWIAASRDPYFIGSGNYRDTLITKLKEIKNLGIKKIIIVGQIPTWNQSLPEQLYRNFIKNENKIPQRTKLGLNAQSLSIDHTMSKWSYPENVEYISIQETLCNAEGCLISVGPNIETDITVWDYGHLTYSGAEFIAKNTVGPKTINLLQNPGLPIN